MEAVLVCNGRTGKGAPSSGKTVEEHAARKTRIRACTFCVVCVVMWAVSIRLFLSTFDNYAVCRATFQQGLPVTLDPEQFLEVKAAESNAKNVFCQSH
jgi:hypothetical protein